MAAVSPLSMLAEEIRLQIVAAITQNANKLNIAEHPTERALLAHDVVLVEFGDISREAESNEADMVTYSFAVLFATMATSPEAGGRTLEDWVRTASTTLGDRASDRSPLRTVPLPLSSLTLSNSVVFDVRIGQSSPGTVKGEGEQGYRLARSLELTVVCHETRTA